MTFAKALKEASDNGGQKSTCLTRRVLMDMSEEDRAVLQNALNDTGISTSVIFRALRSEGHNLSYDSVYRHRRGVCLCGR